VWFFSHSDAGPPILAEAVGVLELAVAAGDTNWGSVEATLAECSVFTYASCRIAELALPGLKLHLVGRGLKAAVYEATVREAAERFKKIPDALLACVNESDYQGYWRAVSRATKLGWTYSKRHPRAVCNSNSAYLLRANDGAGPIGARLLPAGWPNRILRGAGQGSHAIIGPSGKPTARGFAARHSARARCDRNCQNYRSNVERSGRSLPISCREAGSSSVLPGAARR
jgi:hypothetical protein